MILAALVGVLVNSSPSFGGAYEDARAAYMRGDHVTAVRLWRPLAYLGRADAQYYLGNEYNLGRGVPNDYAEAAKWFRKAADQGHAGAQHHLGALYALGRGVLQDFTEAARWDRKSAEQGNAFAQLTLIDLHSRSGPIPSDTNGRLWRQDKDEAARWFRRIEDAARQGNAEAQYNLGLLFKFGSSVAKNEKEAARWISKAAKQGSAEAQTLLGKSYLRGWRFD